MSEAEKMLRAYLEDMPTCTGLLNQLLAEQRVAGFEDAMGVFSKLQAEMQRQSAAAKLPEKRRDCAEEAKRASWAIHRLRAEAGRRKGKKG